MKELNYCSECDKKLSESDKESNREANLDYEDWICEGCNQGSFPE